MCGSKNKYQKDTCLKEIGPHAPILYHILYSIDYILRGNIYDYLIRGRIICEDIHLSYESHKNIETMDMIWNG